MYGMTNVAEREAAAAAVLLPVQQASLLFLQSHLSLSTPGAANLERFRPFGLLYLALRAITLLKGLVTDDFFCSIEHKLTTLTQSCAWLIYVVKIMLLSVALVWS